VHILKNTGHNRLGAQGEIEIAAMLTEAGYKVRPGYDGCDLVVVNKETGEMLHLEVKTARKTAKGFQFCLRKRDHTSVDLSDAIILVCVYSSGRIKTYCAKPCELPHQKMTVTTTQRWSLLEKEPAKFIGQLFAQAIL